MHFTRAHRHTTLQEKGHKTLAALFYLLVVARRLPSPPSWRTVMFTALTETHERYTRYTYKLRLEMRCRQLGFPSAFVPPLCCVLFMLLHVFLIVSREIITPDHVAFKQAPSGFTAVKGTAIKQTKKIHWWELKWPDGTVIVYTAMCKTRWRLWPEPTAGGELLQIPHPSPAAVKEFESEKQLITQLQDLLGWFLHSKLSSTLWKTRLIIQ